MKKWVVNGCAYNEESKEDIEELKRLFYSDRLTQSGKRKLIRYYEKRIKQLEEENKSKQKAYDDCYCEYKHYKQFDSIPKSKVKDKIKELDKEKLKYDNDLRIYTLRNTFDFQKEVLQELLGEE